MELVTPYEWIGRAAAFLPDQLPEAAVYIEVLFNNYEMTFEGQLTVYRALEAVVNAARSSNTCESKEIPINLYYRKDTRREECTLLHIQVGINVMRPYLKLFLYNKKSKLYKKLRDQGFLDELFEINLPPRADLTWT
jgi:hypothetical protein